MLFNYKSSILSLTLSLLSLLLMSCSSSDGSDSDDSVPDDNNNNVLSGLDSRSDNMNCIAPASAGSIPGGLNFVDVFPNLDLSDTQFPLGMYQMPGNDNYFFVINRDGRIFRFNNDPVVTTKTELINLNVNDLGSEGGLLGLAFHPQVASNHIVYVSYTTTGGGAAGQSIISKLTMSADFSSIDPASERVVLRVNQPYGNHDGGDIHFGPDGYLYFGLGDGGSGNDPDGNGQNTNTLLGSMLRIDVDPNADTAPFYSIPNDNPFAVSGGLAEIYAYGLRNPFRWSFDRATGELWVADVGQGAREEVDQIVKGGNYGWDQMEGDNCRIADCSAFIAPIHDYPRSVGYSITGGYVYRGTNIPTLDGAYVFGDYGSGIVWTLTPSSSGYVRTEIASPASGAIVSFAQDNDGEVYLLLAFPSNGRSILKLQSSPGAPSSNIPDILSQTGCFEPSNPSQPDPSLIPYDVISPLWSDGAQKQRWMALPNGETIDVDVQGDFDFPVGTILAKHFINANTLIETRLLMLHQTGWAGYSYKWRADQSDADLLIAANDDNVAGLDWHFPSSAECRQCHTQVKNFALGPEVLQLNKELLYPQTGRTANQIETLDNISVFSSTPLSNFSGVKLFAPNDSNGSLEQRAKSYLHSNCSQCHQPGGTGEGNIDLRFETPFSAMGVCDVVPTINFGSNPNNRYIAPGSPSDSDLLTRMQSSVASGNRMPPLATSVVDVETIDLLTDWINSITTCP